LRDDKDGFHSLRSWEIAPENIMAIMVDNAFNNDTFMAPDWLMSNEHHIRCFAHVLNLVAKGLLKKQ
jgi:hypothetical protein